MAAFTGSPTGSTQYNQQVGVLQGGVSFGEKLKMRRFSYTHAAGAGTGEVNLVELPVGKLTILPDLSRIVASTFVTGADLHLGHRAYTEPDGDAVVQDDNAFADNLDAGPAGGGIDVAWPLPAIGFFEANVGQAAAGVRPGFTIYAMIDTANIEDGDTINGYVVWADPA